jgi:lipid A 3-O-deacylase
MQYFKNRLLVYISLMVSLQSSLFSDTLSVIIENDAFTNDDSGYTSGIRLGWLGDEINADAYESDFSYGRFMQGAIDSIPLLELDTSKKHNAGISLYQMIFTPEDISKKEPDYNDIPYSGTLLASFFLFEWDEDSYHEYSLDLGMVGPSTKTEQLQKTAHVITGNNEPEGWNNQIDDQFLLGISYGYGHKTWKSKDRVTYKSDWNNAFRCQAGNFSTGASISSIIRFGNNYPENFNAIFPGAMTNSGLLSLSNNSERLGWSVSAGVAADAIAYFYVIDSANEYDIDRNKYSASAVASTSLFYGGAELTFSLLTRTKLIDEASSDVVTFGRIAFLYHF